MKLLITSVGSLVGQNIMDVLEFPGFSRRSRIEVVGINSLPDSPSNFRCDRCYLVPETSAAEYVPRLRQILSEESPALILCGRDEDTVVLSQLKTMQPDLPGALPCASSHAALLAHDKWQTSLFARRQALPFADTYVPDASGGEANLLAFCEHVGYPVVAKPVRGSASRGVFFVRNPADARLMAQRQGLLFQEYLGDPATLAPYFESLQGPAPLFAQCQDAGHYSCHTSIAPKGRFGPVFVMYNHHEYGHSVWNRRVSDVTLEALTLAYAEGLVAEGATGPLNVQFRRDRRGDWKVQEINLRNTGSTLARFLLGLDEIYLIVRDFVPGVVFPELHPCENDRIEQVIKRYLAYPISASAVATLRSSGVWCRS